MQIREANHSDIPAILKVLKASLGETSSKKTEEVWKYKHIDNPFGESLVLVAEEDNELIGVRAFMRWKWQLGAKIYSAFRAVDTATHPNHQGKGIFKKLTLKALEIAKEKDDHFVFNTPNTQSKPGYLKMGWEEVEKLRIQLRPLNPLATKNKALEYDVTGEKEESKELLVWFQSNKEETNRFFTPKNLAYLEWRYIENPLQQYNVVYDKSYFIAGYVKERNRFNEFRISEAVIDKGAKKQAKSAILKMAKASGAQILSISPNTAIKFKSGLSGNYGPVLTCKPINLTEQEIKNLLDMSTWDYSLGDLELF